MLENLTQVSPQGYLGDLCYSQRYSPLGNKLTLLLSQANQILRSGSAIQETVK